MMKEQKLNEAKEASLNDKSGSDFDSVRLRGIAMAVRGYFSERKVSNLFVARIVDRLAKSGCTSMMDRSEIDGHLRETVRRCPDWLSVVPNLEGDILRQGKSYQLSDIYKLLDL